MATVTKDFKIKSGLVVEGANATVNGSDVITEDTITGGTQTNIAVTYDAQNKVLNFVAESGLGDGTTDDLQEGTENLYYTDSRVDDHLSITNPNFGTQTNVNNPVRYNSGSVTLNLASEAGLEVRSSVVGPGLGVNVKENAGLYIDGSNGVEIDRTTVDTWYDANGAAATAQQNAEDYADGLINDASSSSTEVWSAYKTGTEIGLAESDANSYTDTKIGNTYGKSVVEWAGENFDALGAAATAEQNANDYTDTAIGNISTTLSIAGDTGTDSVTLGADTLTFEGGTGIEIAVTNNKVSASIDSTVATLSGAQTFSNKEFNGETKFHAANGAGSLSINLNSSTGATSITANNDDLTITTNSGDIVLSPSGEAYVGSASAGNKIATNSYVDNAISGLDWKQAVHLLYDAAIPVLSGSGATQLIVDGHDPLGDADSGYRLLLAATGGATTDGIYVFNSTGGSWTLTRATDADAFGELVGAAVYVMEGTQYGSTSWVQSNHYLTNFSGQNWTQFSGQGSVTAGTGIIVNGLEVSVDTDVIATQFYANAAVGTHSDYTSNVHGVTGDVVGTSDFQTLSNKTLGSDLDVNYNNLNNVGIIGAGNINANGVYVSEIIVNNDTLHVYDDVVSVTGDIVFGGALGLGGPGKITNLEDPTDAQGAATKNYVDTELDGYLNSTSGSEGTTILYVQDYVATAIETGDATATPTYLAVDINSIATQVAATATTNGGSAEVVYEFNDSFRAAKFLVKLARGTHTEVSEVLLTLDTADNIAITEYAVVGTNGSLGTISATYNGIDEKVQLTVDTPAATTVKVAGTLLA